MIQHAAAAILALFPLPAQAQRDTAPYKASGTAPFWSLTIQGATIHFESVGERAVIVAAPRPIIGFARERYVTQALTLDITNAKCSDGMSDTHYRDTVTVHVGGRTLHGCGDPSLSPTLPPASLLEGEWTVQTVGGHPPAAGTRPWIRFSGARLTGNTGCNSFNGTFAFARGRLSAGPLATTRRACIGRGNAQERGLLALLGQRLSVSRNPNGKLVMTGRGGTTLVLAARRR